ncbi:TIGR03620 family F420-dependent LLM class oxidoreductase [Mangrovimicrobium sediminis]|uniref:TIGR03620 family F420-dependent LLM class oxidoreductase n=1 Tax=Mangrovimicrobium sediminis TaxID=2562682 RepID=A0A4Z0M9S0_9GAMM|nr:TIGR03620 family F420-dependent LLM class oxidoreductase [Haliea sp. SAOS-164]TGD76140.1 TIGR03620 family F420-dependent LLM class oxidoreductase [Haliea sp. SAOS-164]
MQLAKLGVWALTHGFTAAEAAAFARRLENWGYGTLWLPEAFGRDPMVAAGWILANTQRLQVATGIANVYARDPMACVNAQYGLAELSAGRFLLGLGVSHAPLVEGWRGHTYGKPLQTMRRYLESMAAVEYVGPAPAQRPATVLGALGPKMLALAASAADGAHPYNVTPDYTARARQILGPGKLLCPEQKVILETSPSRAREIARRVIGHSLPLLNYRNSFLRQGFTEADLAGGGSDRLIDALVAWGDESAIRARLQAHRDAGADQVCVQVLPAQEGNLAPADEKILELLAPAA